MSLYQNYEISQTDQQVLQHMFQALLQFQSNIKLFHFQTPSYESHKNSDWLYNKLNESLDQLLEVSQGAARQRIPQFKAAIEVRTMDEKELLDVETPQYLHYLREIRMWALSAQHEDIVTLIDQLIGDVDHFCYLMTFI